jgi:hypothetical protein
MGKGCSPPSPLSACYLPCFCSYWHEARVRAAAALSGSPEGKARLRIAASTTANPRVRVALEAIAKDDDSELAEALDREDDLDRMQTHSIKTSD